MEDKDKVLNEIEIRSILAYYFCTGPNNITLKADENGITATVISK